MVVVVKETALNTIWNNSECATKQTSPWLSIRWRQNSTMGYEVTYGQVTHSASLASLHNVALTQSTLASFHSVNPSHSPSSLQTQYLFIHRPLCLESASSHQINSHSSFSSNTTCSRNLPWKVLWSICHSCSYTFVCMKTSSNTEITSSIMVYIRVCFCSFTEDGSWKDGQRGSQYLRGKKGYRIWMPEGWGGKKNHTRIAFFFF